MAQRWLLGGVGSGRRAQERDQVWTHRLGQQQEDPPRGPADWLLEEGAQRRPSFPKCQGVAPHQHARPGPSGAWSCVGWISAHPVLGLALSSRSLFNSVAGTSVGWEGRQPRNEGEPLVCTHMRPRTEVPSPSLHPAAAHTATVFNSGCLLESPGQLLKTITARVIA